MRMNAAPRLPGRHRCVLSVWIAALAIAGSPPPAAHSESGQRLERDVVPTFQEIRLRLDPDRPDYSGRVRIELHVGKEVSAFRFHSEGLTLGEIDLRQGGERIEARTEEVAEDELRLTAGRALRPGEAVLTISFTNDFDTRANSLYRLEVDGEGYAFSQFEESDAREAFPCWDEPAFKFPYQMILEVPSGEMAVTNTPVLRETTAGDWREVTFEKTPPLPSYLLAIAVGPLEAVPIAGLSIPGRAITVRGQSGLAAEAVRTTPPILSALEAYFGAPHPYAKLDLIAAPEFSAGAMENPGAIIYADRFLLLDPQRAGLGERRTLAYFTAHELAHQWFGNLVTMEWWDDLWLNESFATWLGNKITEEVYPEFDIGVSTAQDKQGPMMRDARPSTTAIRAPLEKTENLFQRVGLLYEKGQSVLEMFEAYLGPVRFRQGVIRYLEAHAWGNATADDLWTSLSEATGQDVGALMSGFLDRPGVPLVTVEPLEDGRVRLSQRRFANYGEAFEDRTPWNIPMQFVWSDGVTLLRQSALLREESETIRLGAAGRPRWIYPDGDARGYYRWSVPPEMLFALAEDVGSLSTRERVALIGNLQALLDAGEVRGDDFLRVLGLFARDEDPSVLEAVMEAVSGVKQALVPQELEDLFAVYLRRSLGPALDRVGTDPVPGEDESSTLLRPALIGLLADEGRDASLRRRAMETAGRYLADPASVDPTSASVMVRLAAIDGNRERFETYRRRFESAEGPRERSIFLQAMGDFRDPSIMAEALDYTLVGPLRPHELGVIPRGLTSGSERGREMAFQWMMENYDEIVKRLPPVYRPGLAQLAGGCDEERLEIARAFFAGKGEEAAGTMAALERLAEGVSNCRGLREREGERVAKYLEAFAEGRSD